MLLRILFRIRSFFLVWQVNMYCIKSFKTNLLLRKNIFYKDQFNYFTLYFKSSEDAFDFIRFEYPCRDEWFSSYGVILVPVNAKFESDLVFFHFHYKLDTFYINPFEWY